jgi:hypothetical protein
VKRLVALSPKLEGKSDQFELMLDVFQRKRRRISFLS